LINQSYPSNNYEIIIVNDRSTDQTAAIVERYHKNHGLVKLIDVTDLSQGISPKKYAIEQGIKSAKGSIILTTDADCIPGSGWIEAMVSYFEPEVGLVAGFSPLMKAGKKTIFSKLLTLDSLSLAAVAAGSFGLGKPLTCNGRNLAYRKETFKSVDGFKEIQNLISGDDDLFLHLVTRKTSWKARYAIDDRTIVPSQIPGSLKKFANQRIRHASKGRYYSIGLKLSLVLAYLFNLLLLILLPISLFETSLLMPWLICWLAKSLSEFMLVYRFADIFKFKRALNLFPLAMLLHVPYVVIFGLWGQFGKFQWKEDTFKSTAY
jgi:cellulose synthase/poly-beta-1,6-N-acetylglucosamine synthase-like glycosyltransferase